MNASEIEKELSFRRQNPNSKGKLIIDLDEPESLKMERIEFFQRLSNDPFMKKIWDGTVTENDREEYINEFKSFLNGKAK